MFNRPRRFKLSPPVASALLALIVYAITLGGTFVYDDFSIFKGADPRLHAPSKWGQFWTDSYNLGVDNLYRPLVSMTYAVQWLIGGDTIAWPYHAVNWILHASVAACVAELTRRLIASKGDMAAYIAGCLFAVYPVHVEAVANIIGRAELMCALGFLGALILLLHRPMTTGRAWAIVGCFALSLLSKEQGMLVPFVLLVVALAYRIRPRDPAERRADLTLIVLLCWLTAGYIVFRESILKFWWDRNFLDWTINPLVHSTGADRWLLPFAILGRYAALLLLPLHLSPDYGANVIGTTIRGNESWMYVGFAAALMRMIATIVALVKRNAPCIIALLGIGATYGLVSNIFAVIGTSMGERLMYLPSAFFLIFVAVLLTRVPRKLIVGVTCVLVIAGALQSITYARRWNDRLSFYEWAAANQPNAIRLHMLLVGELKTVGRLDDAAAEAARERDLMPDYDEVWIQSADVAIERGRFDEADAFLHHAMHLHPSMKAQGWMDKVSSRRAATQLAPR